MVTVCLCLLAGILGGTVNGQPVERIDLEDYRWKNRLVFVFGPSEADDAYRSFIRQVRDNADEVRDRDLIVFQVLEQGESRVDGRPMTVAAAQSLRLRFAAPTGTFILILVGKDGTEKLRRDTETDIRDILGLIDSMPMRQREMRERADVK
jgi:hypothetical protein